ncbi:unnamed protein product [Calicophoron daubneyi]|uniref:Uncharacterized protein n=1 Tax=Calicophoron daubneyi TaxID=300641 RepID=A0AAV2T1U9_CALDB
MNSRRCIDNFNSNRFFVLLLILCFCLLVSLRLDGLNDWSVWALCTPLWIWKAIIFIGCLLGLASLTSYGSCSCDRSLECVSMVLSTVYHLCLFCFEVLVCFQLQNRSIRWIFVFIPLFLVCIMGVVAAVWAIRNRQPFELELFISVNILSFIFTALRLDLWIQWTWAVVLIPLWIVMSVLVVLEVYGLLLALILCRSPDLVPEQRNHTLTTTIGYAFVVFPLLAFEILVVRRLDGNLHASYFTIFIPMFLSILALMVMAFFIRGTESLWFGLKKPLCQSLLDICLPLQEYGNISYKFANLGRLRYQQRFHGGMTTFDADSVGRGLARTSQPVLLGAGEHGVSTTGRHFNLADDGNLEAGNMPTAAGASSARSASVNIAIEPSAPPGILFSGPKNWISCGKSNRAVPTTGELGAIGSPHTLQLDVPD